MTDPAAFNAYKPAEIAALVETAGVAKARLPLPQMFVLAMLAGAFIGFGAAAYTTAMTGADSASGPVRVLGGAVFSLGLILVVVGGAELFTGNVLMVIAAVDRKIRLRRLWRSWAIVYAGNLAGAAGLAAAFAFTGLLDGPAGATAARIAEAKSALSPVEAFLRGALCNGLVCLAVWLSFAARTAAGKILAVLWPITAFVLLGLEHSVANMFFFPQGWAAGADVSLHAAAANLFWVTLGNIAGGAGGVAFAYWFAYLGRTAPAAGKAQRKR
ncbi:MULTISPECIES: formate/nitrite transporter family protein [Leisingera]|jgi:formate/nitrite transporter|uniref:formate/nitrite transporter family protein n=1 Tax=Leisingera TaxID=191028 RepID=UPI00114EFDDA|nr:MULTISPECIES: formate/nitrite transporter family protein [Leisingera]QDI78186.1 formate/nitrite transporter family protein [Leisingera aquaemixtae]